MKRNWMASGALSMFALSFLNVEATLAQDVVFGQDSASEKETVIESKSGRQRVLVQVAPEAQDEDSFWFRIGSGQQGADDADRVEFSPDHWLYQLTESDLEQRMRNFDEIVKLARRDPAAHEWLLERSTDTVDPELRWTTQLALREVNRMGNRIFFGTHDGHQPQHLAPGASQDEVRDSIMKLFGGSHLRFGPGGLDALDSVRSFGGHGSGQNQSKSVRVEASPDGVRVTVTETVDGQEQTTDYEAENMEALFEAHPELKGQLGGGARMLRFRVPGGDSLLDLDGLQLELDLKFGDLVPFGDQHVSEGSGGLWIERRERKDIFGVYVSQPTAEQLQQRGLEPGTGVLVDGTAPQTMAAGLGIAAGDILLTMNGVQLERSDQIGEVLRARAQGTDLVVEGIDLRGQKWTKTWTPPAQSK